MENFIFREKVSVNTVLTVFCLISLKLKICFSVLQLLVVLRNHPVPKEKILPMHLVCISLFIEICHSFLLDLRKRRVLWNYCFLSVRVPVRRSWVFLDTLPIFFQPNLIYLLRFLQINLFLTPCLLNWFLCSPQLMTIFMGNTT